MLSLRKINPMARAVGTMGIVATMVGAVTFANLTSNTVALSPNTLTTATAALAIGPGTNCPAGDTTVTPGLSSTTLTPGGAAVTAPFCLDNTGGVDLTISASIPQDLSASLAAQHTTLSITCAGLGTVSGTLSAWGTPGFASNLTGANTPSDCTASATLDSGYSGPGGEAIPAFTVNFVGTQPNET